MNAYYNVVLTFAHLSDIHFSKRNDGNQFDVDQQVRRALLDDLEEKPADGAAYNGLLITGDIAFTGKTDDYRRVQNWLDKVFAKTGASPAKTYFVPGNHDVDRDYVDPTFPLWDSHVRLRESADSVVWRDVIDKQLQRDPLHSLLAPLTAYNDFAQGYGCRTEALQLAWQRMFEEKLEDGSLLRFHGLNSALISDEGDVPGKLLVSEFQTALFARTPGVTDVVLCHHPPEWLMDKATIRNCLRAFAPLTLFGHEHSTRITADEKQVQLFAGAVQPSRRDPGWLPTYHIVQLSIATKNNARHLLIRVHTREYDSETYKFRTRRNEDDNTVDEHLIQLPAWTPTSREAAVVSTAKKDDKSSVSTEPAMPTAESSTPSSMELAQRELLVHFFRLGSPLRYTTAYEAGLLRDGDDSLPPQTMWAEVFRRASAEQALEKFWDAVAARTPELKDKQNPFKK
jgi:predicted MPP superfamily phosphohydrolase